MTTETPRPDRNLALELVRVTEAAALAAGRWIGRGDKIAADAAAVDAMRLMIDTVSMHGTVVIGEGEKDEAPMLFNGEEVGDGCGPGVDVAVDPIDGTRLTALGQPNALAVIALAERGSMFFPGAAVYMEKVATGPEARRCDRHHGVAGGERPPGREGQRRAARGDHRDDPRSRAARRADRRGPRRRRPGVPDHRRRRGGSHRRGDAAIGRGPAARDRRHARGRDHGRGPQVPGWRDPRTSVAHGPTRSEERCSIRGSISTGCSRTTTSSRGERCSSRRPA